MRLILIFSTILIINSICFAYQSKNDSLIKSIPQTENDSSRAMLLCKVAMNLFYSYPDSSKKFVNMAMQIGKEIDNKPVIAKSYNILGIIFDITNKWDSALYCYDIAVELAIKSNSKNTLASAFNNIGLINWNKSNYDDAIFYFNKSLKLFEEQDDKKGIGNALNNIGLIYWEQERLEEALYYQRKGLQNYLSINHEYGIGASYTNIARLYEEIGSKDSAYFYTYLSIENKIKTNDNYGLAISFNNLATIYEEDKQIDSALKYYTKSVDKYKELGNLGRCASSLYNLSSVYKDQYNDLSKAEEYLHEAMKYAEKSEAKSILCKIYGNLGNLYYDWRKYKLASDFLWKRIEIHDSLYNIERDEKIAEIQTKYETEKKDKNIAVLEGKKAHADLEISNRNTWILGLGAGIIGILLLGLLIIQRNKRKAAAEKNTAIIYEQEQGIKAIIQAQEEERKRIAKDLHDGIVQQLGGVIIAWQKRISHNKTEKPDETALLKSLEDSSNELREISHRMMPKALSELGVVAALEDLLEKSLGQSEIKYEFEYFGINERFKENIEITIYRITQELINNILKHSEADRVSFQLVKSGVTVALIVEDNGKGFSESKKKKGIGLMNISSRLDTVNGTINFEPGTQKGTLITINIPIY
jgi:signal transduction histidine kinase